MERSGEVEFQVEHMLGFSLFFHILNIYLRTCNYLKISWNIEIIIIVQLRNVALHSRKYKILN